MNPVEFISAGAGSGKTYRLTNVLADALASGAARPHAILATTFTVKAATELRERARDWLLKSKRLDLATAVGQASIGTVNSVCGHLLKRFCFEVGLSPDQTVLSKPQVDALLEQALDDTLDNAARSELVTLLRRFDIADDDWTKTIGDVMRSARENDISEADLRAMGPINADKMLAHWPKPDAGVDLTAGLTAALAIACTAAEREVSEVLAAGKEPAKNMRDGVADLRNLLRDFERSAWTWPDWLKAGKLKGGAKLRSVIEPVSELAQAHERHPQFHADVRRFLELVFDLAAKTLERFARAKRELGALDFVDQEVLLLRALRESEEVRRALASELDLVMVDEFQDTSPLQLALFVELAKLAKKSVWVGDPKQAIYGFRGTDATLVARIVESIEGWGGILGEPLTDSRRSTPALVSLTNEVFVPAFAPGIAANEVKLSAVREDLPGQPALYNWTFESPKNDHDYLGLGPAVTDFLASDAKVIDKVTKQPRAVGPGDLAVLCATHDQVALAVASLAAWGIPAASGRQGLLGTPEALFVVACLRRMQDVNDTVATALILTLSGGVAPAEWLRDRLEYLDTEQPSGQWRTSGADANPLLARLEALRPSLFALTPSEALRLAKSESHVASMANRWSRTPQEAMVRIANVEAVLAMGKTYEDECISAKRPATVGGLLRWLASRANAGEDARAVAAEGAVGVLTHHSAKGLEWPVAILTGLNKDTRTTLWDVRARTDGTFDAQAPLNNRFIHCWPYPYGRYGLRTKPQAVLDAEASPLGTGMAQSSLEESKRLFYVSMTRARDALVLMSAQRKSGPQRRWVDDVGASGVLFGDSDVLSMSGGQKVQRESRTWTEDECAAETPDAGTQERVWFTRGETLEVRPLWFRPSSAHGGRFIRTFLGDVGTRIAITADVDMSALGTALHLCIARAALSTAAMSADDVRPILARWGVAHAVTAEAVLGQTHALMAWIQQRWPGAPAFVEVPVEVALEDGRRLRGQIDFLVDAPEGWVLIDHKANPRGAARDDALVQKHGLQLESYADALVRATSRPVIEKWLFLPVAAQAVQVERVLAVARAA